jgi:hypothetical protein
MFVIPVLFAASRPSFLVFGKQIKQRKEWLHFFACRSSAVRFSVAAWFGSGHSLK